MVSLAARPDLGDRAARWFSAHWGVPEAEYRASIQASLAQGPGVPQWYVTLSPAGEIVAGMGLIPQDFHDRPDLTPNLCALFVEEAWRGQGLARALLDLARREAGAAGIPRLYLVTDHTAFYEKCGWTYLTQARDTETGEPIRVYTAATEGAR